ncbi:molybdopterin cofactor-binding domain-containing protein [Noviherbaspirillum sp. CPCC 100848]|uniref:Molybdopterin cofactor-binding domain-containing protein n=1 Tax=Noviherbaspirillum album TaxID=3080276 RepID=A0ABU6JGP3_9BURK|nr:molybdopterin cofactor-binding domain-containing protein [Noviherbaspirillum sp. CPCC 100848]MEC4722831.1 molybdopterin cofactor-binding domain-containing protein [Noviherbaspirillum sp. CPCC 100848]
MSTKVSLNRRQFLKAGAAGGLMLSVGLPITYAETVDSSEPARLGAFIRIGADGRVALIAPCVEMGQGSHSGLAMILADELGADWSKVSVEAPPIGVAYRVPGRGIQNTSASQMVRRWNTPLRHSAAAAREMLTVAGATRLGVAADACTVRDGFIIHEESQRRIAFGEVAAAAAKLPQPKEPVLRKGPATIVGKPLPRLDIPSKVDGSARFGIDTRVPGMLYAAIRQSPVFSAKLVSVDEKDVRSRKGIIDVIKLPDAVVVVADSYWRAKTAIALIEPVFSDTPHAATSTRDIQASQRLQLQSPVAMPSVVVGDATKSLAAAKIRVTADYEVPFLHHATMEPMTCTVSVTDQSCELWVSSQNLTGVVETAARVTGLPQDKINVHAMLLGGGFGRKFEQDAVEQATLIGKAVKRPVQLIWSREEDVQHGFYRPAMVGRVSAGFDEQGNISALTMRLIGPSVHEHTFNNPFPLVRGVDVVAMIGVTSESPGAPGLIQQYTIKNARVEYIYQPTHVPVGYWRSIGASENGFFIESLIDEAAARLKTDPYQLRRRLMQDSPRAVTVLDKLASESGWNKALMPGRFRGIAFTDTVGSLTAQVIEISVAKKSVKVHRIVCVIDCGTAVNPDNVIAQVQGSIVMGLSAAMTEQITVERGRVLQSNFHDYRVLSLKETPRIEVHIVDSGGPIGGVGEAALPAVAPALCSAIHAATGKRIRSLPLSQAGYQWA